MRRCKTEPNTRAKSTTTTARVSPWRNRPPHHTVEQHQASATALHPSKAPLRRVGRASPAQSATQNPRQEPLDDGAKRDGPQSPTPPGSNGSALPGTRAARSLPRNQGSPPPHRMALKMRASPSPSPSHISRRDLPMSTGPGALPPPEPPTAANTPLGVMATSDGAPLAQGKVPNTPSSQHPPSLSHSSPQASSTMMLMLHEVASPTIQDWGCGSSHVPPVQALDGPVFIPPVCLGHAGPTRCPRPTHAHYVGAPHQLHVER